jgi:hypothetical protein
VTSVTWMILHRFWGSCIVCGGEGGGVCVVLLVHISPPCIMYLVLLVFIICLFVGFGSTRV